MILHNKFLRLICLCTLFFFYAFAPKGGRPVIIYEDTTYSCPNQGASASAGNTLTLDFAGNGIDVTITALNAENTVVYTETVGIANTVTIPCESWTTGNYTFTLKDSQNCESYLKVQVGK